MQHNEAPTVERLYGNVASLLNFAVNFNDAGLAAGVRKFRIAATATNPVLMEVFSEVETPFAGGTSDLTAGSDETANQLIATGDITEGTAGMSAVKRVRLTAEYAFYVKSTITGTPTAGRVRFYVRLTPLTQPKNPVAI